MDKKGKTSLVSTEDIQEIASQLSCPSGSKGKEIGELLHSTNIDMIHESILALQLKDHHNVLELGHGNCSHLSYLMKKATDLKYVGMEISDVMQQEAERINEPFINKNQALFKVFDGMNIPNTDSFFDAAFSVNTLYFWEQPRAFLNEIYRVLKTQGVLVVTFVNKASMELLPFVAQTNVFTLYDQQKFLSLVSDTNFQVTAVETTIEQVKSKTGEWVNREYCIAILTK
ncbi:class I SAM-dependent methyltransferase [Alteromonas sp. 5E99-2]|uniref:class I SAM-dependent methyltransferase n=1 Tax=Alteromonas sp. 5E99-2 TaxID=2817683 RepID=UPI001A97DB8C|nr:class I SAM-dependent methyltransferase [Alteromonas sp. 5E99-2]MBO1254688.1 class I SAM-dependent methyltransferase [Alteromonas sp. 5E99-2]